MNSQDFLKLTLFAATAFIAWYAFSYANRNKRPTKLNLKAKETSVPFSIRSGNDNASQGVVLHSDEMITSDPLHPDFKANSSMKSLNILFNYNGHTWDAFEVLGVPAGASVSMVTAAYQSALKVQDRQSYEFLETAYKAILARR